MNPFSVLAAKIYAGLFGAALALLAVQTVRIDGLWFITGLEEKLATARQNLLNEKAGRKADRAAWAHQVALAHAATVAAERTSKEISIDAEASHDKLLADNAGLRDYIAAHRLPVAASGGAAAPASAAGNHSAGIPAATATGALVATSEADLVKCDADYAYALSSYDYGQKLIAGGLAK